MDSCGGIQDLGKGICRMKRTLKQVGEVDAAYDVAAPSMRKLQKFSPQSFLSASSVPPLCLLGVVLLHPSPSPSPSPSPFPCLSPSSFSSPPCRACAQIRSIEIKSNQAENGPRSIRSTMNLAQQEHTPSPLHLFSPPLLRPDDIIPNPEAHILRKQPNDSPPHAHIRLSTLTEGNL